MNNLEIEFRLQLERRYLEQNPSEATQTALDYLEDFLNLAKEMRKLEQKLESVTADNQRLTSQLIEMLKATLIRLPSFLNCQRH